ncbi:nucleotidyltransferase domain-containing protein [Brevibacterium otitidis]|uniref:Nucleotidyltransferase domain-containing protein n=1 Tax=Brevibacterium otitidis TaxID=53364 RepID=A0ABV5X5S8_9MICO|nr:hypothetical protein GCM10023233_17350 [Brevibacterium otitidis]
MDELPHEGLARREAIRLADSPGVVAVLLAGSVARGEHACCSDVDILVVGPPQGVLEPTRVMGGVSVERLCNTPDEWKLRFNRVGTSWLYEFLDVVVLYDPDGVGRQLQLEAARVLHQYCTPKEQRANLRRELIHGVAKLDRARLSGESAWAGFWAALPVFTLLSGLFALHDVPLPGASRMMRELPRVGLSEWESGHVGQLLTGDTEQRLAAAQALCDYLIEALGHEPAGGKGG